MITNGTFREKNKYGGWSGTYFFKVFLQWTKANFFLIFAITQYD